jgi:hypothetical protein
MWERIMLAAAITCGGMAAVLLLVLALFAPRDVFADTAWGDVVPTNTVESVVADSGFATTGYVHSVAAEALYALTNDFAANFTPLAAPLVTNLVEDVLAPRTMEFRYWSTDGSVITNAFSAPRFATSKLEFVADNPDGGTADHDIAYLYAEGKLRNYSVLVESLPEGAKHMVFAFHELAKTHRIYAQPRLYDSQLETLENGDPVPYCWDLYTNDVPCVVTVREPEAGTLIVRRDRLDQDELHIRREGDEVFVYSDGEPE